MFWKKRQDEVKRCPNGHIMDPSWDHCPYCDDGLDGSGEYLDGRAAAPADDSYSPAAPPGPSGPWSRPPASPPPVHRPPASPPPSSPPSPPPSPPPRPAAPAPRPAAAPGPPTPPPSPVGGEDVDDLTVINAARAPAGPPPAPPQRPETPAPPGGAPPERAGTPPPPPVPPPSQPPGGSDVTQVLTSPVGQKDLVAWLVVASGSQRGRDFRLPGGTARLGTHPDCEICLGDEAYVSSRHAELRFEGGRYVLRDLNSTNGTFVNEERVSERPLQDGDRVRLALTQLVFKTLQL